MVLTNPETPLASNLHQPQPTPRFARPLMNLVRMNHEEPTFQLPHLVCAQTPNWNASDELSPRGRRGWAAYETFNSCNKDFTSYPRSRKI
jgi:hypothetical protein